MKTLENTIGPRYGRPCERYGPPTVLFNRELAILKHDLENFEQFGQNFEGVDDAFQFICSSARLFRDEQSRGELVRQSLEKLLPLEAQWQEDVAEGKAKPDGIWIESGFAYMIYELKNEQGLGGDPFLRSLCVYGHLVKQDHVTSFSLSQ
jgi:hypothetical protein